MSARILLVLGAFVCAYGLIYYVLARRLLGPWKHAGRLKRVMWALIMLASPLSVAGWMAGRILPRNYWTLALQWVGLSIMGWFFITLFFVLVRDLVFFIAKVVKKRMPSPPSKAGVPDPDRRAILQGTSSLAVAAASAGVSSYGIHTARQTAALRYVDIPIKGLDARLDGLVILQLSDIHVGDTIGRRYVERIVERCQEVDADLIVITGDLVDGEVEELRHDVAPLFELKAPKGVYFVTGNHEYYVDTLSWVDHLRENGFDVLLDEHRVMEHNGAEWVLGGVTDYSAPSIIPNHVSDPEIAFRGAPTTALRVLLAHQPRSYYATKGLEVDLQLSGHTHGGQIWPFTYLVLLQNPFIAGLHRVWGSMWLYISRGTGYWGPPMRVAAPSEITVLTLRKR